MSRFSKGSIWTHQRFALRKIAPSRDPIVATVLGKDWTCAGVSSSLMARVPSTSCLPCLRLKRQHCATTGKQSYRFLHTSSWSFSAAKQKAVHITLKEAKKYVVSLTPREREHFKTALDECIADDNGSRSPSLVQLRYGRCFLND